MRCDVKVKRPILDRHVPARVCRQRLARLRCAQRCHIQVVQLRTRCRHQRCAKLKPRARSIVRLQAHHATRTDLHSLRIPNAAKLTIVHQLNPLPLARMAEHARHRPQRPSNLHLQIQARLLRPICHRAHLRINARLLLHPSRILHKERHPNPQSRTNSPSGLVLQHQAVDRACCGVAGCAGDAARGRHCGCRNLPASAVHHSLAVGDCPCNGPIHQVQLRRSG